MMYLEGNQVRERYIIVYALVSYIYVGIDNGPGLSDVDYRSIQDSLSLVILHYL